MEDNYAVQTEAMVRQGLRVFQGAMFSDDELVHCQKLLNYFAIEPGSHVVDMGCGIGEVGKLFSEIDHTLRFTGVSDQSCQMLALPDGMSGILSDFENTPLPNEVADVVMFNESFGYGDVRALLHESARLLKSGGHLCIKDFSFGAYSPNDTARQRAWNYTVHNPDSLVAYADEAGFDALRVMPCMEADFSRWRAAMAQEPSFHGHTHPTEGSKVFAAIYVFEKRGENYARFNDHELLEHAMQGNQHAIQLVRDWTKALHLWDDLIDGDKPVSTDDVNAIFRKMLVEIPANPFFASHAPALLPVLSSGITAWHASNVFEASGRRELIAQAHMLRMQVASVFVACAEIIGGHQWAAEVAPLLWQQIQGDRLHKYINEIELRNQSQIQKESIC